MYGKFVLLPQHHTGFTDFPQNWRRSPSANFDEHLYDWYHALRGAMAAKAGGSYGLMGAPEKSYRGGGGSIRTPDLLEGGQD